MYEEEVFSSDYALWWSPDSSRIAFLSLDETAVDEYVVPIYNPTGDSYSVHPYTSELIMKYPKPGYANPLVQLRVFDLAAYNQRALDGLDDFDHGENGISKGVEDNIVTLTWSGRQDVNDTVIAEVAWVAPEVLMIREVNRAADDGSVVHFDLSRSSGNSEALGQVVRRLGKEGEEGDRGWIECVSE